MEVFGPFLDGYGNAGIELWEHLRKKTFAALDAHEARKAAMAAPEDVHERARAIREWFLESIGGLPDATGPLNAVVKGRVARDGYAIEKVIFESQPEVYVTALLYLPEKIDAPAPAVLFVCGHAREAKAHPEYQRVCHDLAINGFVVLAIDPTGQGERVTHLNPDTGEMAIQWGTTEHSYQGQQCVLAGTSIARYFVWDALRGIDYLQSRLEVDAERIGVTGNSGGGTQTSLLCMTGDPRIKAAAPCTYVTSREHYYMTGQPQDAEQLQSGMTKHGVNFDDFFIPFAPRPVLIGAVASDFFNPEGTELTYQRLRRAYALLGAEDRVQRVFAPGRHAYCRELRQAAVNWFRQHLQSAPPTYVSPADEAIEILSDAELWCTSKGHVLSDFPNAKTPYHLNLACIPERTPSRDAEDLRACVTDALGIRERMEAATPFFPRTLREQELDGVRVDSILFCGEPGIMLCGALMYAGPCAGDDVTLFLGDGGTPEIEHDWAALHDEVRDGSAAFVMDVRGTGALKPHPVNAYPETFPMTFFNTEAWLAWSAYCLGESLLGMRVFDVVRAIRFLRDERGYRRVGLRALGLEPALWGYLAAALDPSVRPVRIQVLIESFEAIVRAPLYRKDIRPSMLVHGVLKAFDLPDLLSLFVGRELNVEYASVTDA